MTGSLSIHGALTEDVRKTMSGKGREGNKEGKGVRVETSHHDVAFLEAHIDEPRATDHRLGMMSGANG